MTALTQTSTHRIHVEATSHPYTEAGDSAVSRTLFKIALDVSERTYCSSKETLTEGPAADPDEDLAETESIQEKESTTLCAIKGGSVIGAILRDRMSHTMADSDSDLAQTTPSTSEESTSAETPLSNRPHKR